MALSLLSLPVMASMGGSLFGGNDGNGIFETEASSIKFPAFQDTNVDDLVVGDDKAIAFAGIWQTGFRHPEATNNLEIAKNQDSGACTNCTDIYENITDGEYYETCTDTCTKVNLESIKVGNRDALAFGFAEATNNVKIVTNQR